MVNKNNRNYVPKTRNRKAQPWIEKSLAKKLKRYLEIVEALKDLGYSSEEADSWAHIQLKREGYVLKREMH